ncbi:MAG: FkbM family methyltransferase [Vicinamibacterales bacterium]|jgi:FkbM family methyltransferase
MAYRIGSVDRLVLGESFDSDPFLAAMPDYALPADAIVPDVGAHIGTFSQLAAAKAPRGRVYAIEASRETFDLLTADVALSGLANIRADHLALADREGAIELHHDPDGNCGHSITAPLSGSSEWVAGTTLGQYLDTRDVRSVRVAKFSCEGAEFPTLLSSSGVVMARIERMIVLYHCDLVDETPESLVSHLNAHGFATSITNQTKDRGWILATRRPSGEAPP